MIRNASPDDARALCGIYNHFVRHTTATFEEHPVTESDMVHRITTVCATLPWLVYERDRTILGYAYAGPWKTRSAYRHSVEGTVYLAPGSEGHGVGTQLYKTLLTELKQGQVHCVIGGIALPNPASVALHEKLGFTNVAHFHEVGFKFDRWIDVGYWQKML